MDYLESLKKFVRDQHHPELPIDLDSKTSIKENLKKHHCKSKNTIKNREARHKKVENLEKKTGKSVVKKPQCNDILSLNNLTKEPDKIYLLDFSGNLKTLSYLKTKRITYQSWNKKDPMLERLAWQGQIYKKTSKTRHWIQDERFPQGRKRKKWDGQKTAVGFCKDLKIGSFDDLTAEPVKPLWKRKHDKIVALWEWEQANKQTKKSEPVQHFPKPSGTFEDKKKDYINQLKNLE